MPQQFMAGGQWTRRATGGGCSLVVATVNPAGPSLHPERADFVCDGADDQITIQAAVDLIDTVGGGIVQIMEGNYNFSGAVLPTDLVIVRGVGDNTYITLIDTTVDPLTVNCLIGETHCHVTDPTKFTVGTILAFDDTAVAPGMGNVVTSVVGNIVNFTPAVQQNYMVANNAVVWNAGGGFYLNGITEAKVCDLKVNCNTAGRVNTQCYDIPTSGFEYPNNAVEINGCTYCETVNISAVGLSTAGIAIDNSSFCAVIGGTIFDVRDSGSSSGVITTSSTSITIDRVTVIGPDTYNLEYAGIRVYYPPSNNITISNCKVTNCHMSIYLQSVPGQVSIEGCSVVEGVYGVVGNGFNSGANRSNAQITGCTFRGQTVAGIDMSAAAQSGSVVNCGFIGCTYGCVNGTKKWSYIGNNFNGGTSGGIHLLADFGTDTATDIIIQNNRFVDNVGPAIYLDTFAAAGGARVHVLDNTFIDDSGTQTYAVQCDAATHTIFISRNNIVSYTTAPFTFAAGTVVYGDYSISSIGCLVPYNTTSILGASGNGTYSALIQPDAVCGRNLVLEKVGGAGAGGSCTITGVDQFGNAVSEAYTFPGGAAVHVDVKIFRSINANGIVIAGMTGGDTIQVGMGNKLGLDHKIFTGAITKIFKNIVGDWPAAQWTIDTTYHGVDVGTGGTSIAANDRYDILSLETMT